MANSQVQYITIDEVVRNLLITEGKDTEHDYMRYHQLALNGLKELSFDVLQEIRTAKIEINPNTHSIELPFDYVNYTKIGLCSDGRIAWMAEDKSMCLPNAFEYEQADTPTVTETITEEFSEIYSNTTGSTAGFFAFPGYTIQTTDGSVEIVQGAGAGGTTAAQFKLNTSNGLSESLIQDEVYKISMDLKKTIQDNSNAGIRISLAGLGPNEPTYLFVVDGFNNTELTTITTTFTAGSVAPQLNFLQFNNNENLIIDNFKIERVTQTVTEVSTFNNTVSGAPGSFNSLTNNTNLEGTPPTYDTLGRRFGKSGGQNKNGYYRVDKENGTIYFSTDVTGEVIVEYISDGSTMIAREKSRGANEVTTTDADGNTIISTNPEDTGEINQRKYTINVFAVEALMAYIYWQSIQRRRGINMNEKVLARREFYNQKRLAKSRMMSFTIEEALVAGRKGFKQSPKL